MPKLHKNMKKKFAQSIKKQQKKKRTKNENEHKK